MKRMLLGAAIAALMTASLPVLSAEPAKNQSLAYELIKPDNAAGSPFSLNRYMLIHHVYMDVFHRFGLIERLGTVDKTKIIAWIGKYLSADYPLGVSFPDFQDGQRLTVSIRANPAKDRMAVILFANYNFETKKIITDKKAMGDAYARVYFIFGDKLVNSHGLFDAKQEAEQLADKEDPAGSKNNLADKYLFDEVIDNDGRAEALLLEAVKAAKIPFEQVIPKMTLAQCYLFLGKPEKVPELLKECGRILAAEKDTKGLGEFLAVMEEEYLIYNDMAKNN